MLLAPATLGPSRPVIESAGLVQSRSTVEPSPIQSMPATAPDSARSRSSGYSTSAAGPACSPSTATLPRSSCRVAISRASVISESGTRPPHMPECTAWVSVRTSTSIRTRPAQAGGEGGHADVPVAGVGDHDDVGAEVVEVLLQQGRQGLGADLLLALDEEHDVDRQVVAEDPQRGEVGGDAGLVVGRAAAVEAVAPLGRLERRGVPVGVVVLGLDVVVGVEQHGRRALGPALVRDDRRGAAVGAGDPGGAALGLQQAGARPRRCGVPRRPARGRRSPTRSGPGPRGRGGCRAAPRLPARGGRRSSGSSPCRDDSEGRRG